MNKGMFQSVGFFLDRYEVVLNEKELCKVIKWRDRRSTISVLPVIMSSLIYIIFPQPLTLSLFCIIGVASVRMAMRN
jgi:hypothetical protein